MRRALIAIIGFIASLSSASAAPATGSRGGWQEFTHPRLGYRITYPADTFVPQETKAEEGFSLVSRDGAARMLIGAFDNEENTSLAEYRNLVLNRSYAGAKLDYAPVRGNWFVVSGERDGQMFYERVHFTCGGRKITSWAMLYPSAERRIYDRIVEAVAPTFRPSAGAAAGC